MNTRRIGLVGALLLALEMAGLGAAQPVTPAFAATTVTDCPTTEAALSTDITNAGSGGTVAFNCTSATTIPFDSAHGGAGSPLTIGQDVTLDASGAPGSVTFDGGRGTQLFFVAEVSLSLIHLTLQNGASGGGGAIYNNGGTLTTTASTFAGNFARDGGAIFNYRGTLTITASTFSGNSGGRNAVSGGGQFGGAIYNNGGTAAITNSTFASNSALDGGAIGNSGTLAITASTFAGNFALGGGAIYNSGTVAITNSTFASNSDGGAISNSGTLTITASTFAGNSAAFGNQGGAIHNYGATLAITASTFAGNSADGGGGAIWNGGNGSSVSIGGSIIANSVGGNCSGPITDNGYNLTDSNGDCGLTGPTDLTNTDPHLDPSGLQPNGGPTLTTALLSTSPAIDQIPTSSGLCTATDQRGAPRPDDGETACDIGAYESSYASTTWTFSLDETGLPATVPHQATVDNQTVTLPFTTTVVDGSTHTYSYPATVADPNPGTRYVTTDAGGSVTVSQNVAHTATYTTQHLLTVGTSGLGSNNTHIGNGTTVLGMATDSSPLSTWLADGTVLSLSADALVSNPNGTQYFFQGFTPAPPGTLSAPVATTARYLTMGQIVSNLGLSRSYADQWTTVQGDIASAQYAAALGDLKGFINHVRAGSRVPAAEATAIQLDALMVYHNQICPALAVGQIGQTAARNDYAYYKTTVTSLGGTPLPAAC